MFLPFVLSYLGITIMKITSVICLVLLFLTNVGYADDLVNERAPLVEELKDGINLKDLTCIFSHKRWGYSEGEKVNGSDLLAPSMHRINNMNPTVQCMHDETCYFTCFDKNNLPYSGNAFATNEMGNIILIRPLKHGLPADGIIKNYDSSGMLDLKIYVKYGLMIRYDIIFEGNRAKHLRDNNNPSVWHIQHFYSNGQIEAEMIIDTKDNKVIQSTEYNDDGTIKN